jgi:hypothetical protein
MSQYILDMVLIPESKQLFTLPKPNQSFPIVLLLKFKAAVCWLSYTYVALAWLLSVIRAQSSYQAAGGLSKLLPNLCEYVFALPAGETLFLNAKKQFVVQVLPRQQPRAHQGIGIRSIIAPSNLRLSSASSADFTRGPRPHTAMNPSFPLFLLPMRLFLERERESWVSGPQDKMVVVAAAAQIWRLEGRPQGTAADRRVGFKVSGFYALPPSPLLIPFLRESHHHRFPCSLFN